MSTVNHPKHYNQTQYEAADVLDAWFPTSPLLWQVGKYISRCDYKDKPIEDLEKAMWYLDREIKRRKSMLT